MTMTQTQEQNVPALRFPEFRGDWGAQRLGDIGPVLMCKRIMKHQTKPIGDIPFYKIGTFGRVPDAFIDSALFEDYREKYPFPKVGDILISAAGTIGRLVVYDGKPAYFQDSNIVWIANDESKIGNTFLFYCYENVRWTTENTTIARLYNENLRGIKLAVPSLPEQQKIAAFLSSVDRKIAQLGRKRELLEQYKKGCMQKLFSGELRFKDAYGNNFPDWEEKRLNDVADKTASSISANSLKDSPGEYPVYGASGIAGYVNYYSSEIPHISVVKDGAGVGRLFFCPAMSSVLGTLESVVAKDGNNTKFVYYWMSKINFKAYTTGSTIPHVYFKDYGRKNGLFPHPDEQQQIADFLSAIDTKIARVSDELTLAQTFKKGLLQQMFI